MSNDQILLEAESVHAVYSQTIKALNGVSFQLRRGEILALLG
jgi:branched-chain amino acid transport system ATP-binding protein